MEPMKELGYERPLILAIDDDREVLDEVTAVLSGANLACHGCTTSEEALSAVQENSPDLILCDLNLNGESGLELYQRIKQQPGLENVPVMFLSTAQLPDIIRRSFNAVSTYCLRKPFDPTVLVELIDQALGVTEA
jgi:CheY-like chemotaxis protein